MKKKAIDPFTKNEFIKKRSNQIYESRESQVRSNNEKAKQKRIAMAEVNKALDTNRKLLKSLVGDEEFVSRSKEFMLGAGFRFEICTHHIKINGVLWHCIYDYRYTKLEDDFFAITKTS